MFILPEKPTKRDYMNMVAATRRDETVRAPHPHFGYVDFIPQPDGSCAMVAPPVIFGKPEQHNVAA